MYFFGRMFVKLRSIITGDFFMEHQDKVKEKDNPAEPESSTNAETQPAPNTETQNTSPAADEKLAGAEAKAAEMEDALLRAKAELENLRRRTREDIARASKFAIEGFAESLVPVKDSLETALRVETPSVESLKQGVEMTLKQMDSAFEKNSLTEISPMPGDKMDPMKHEAISIVPAAQNPNTIINVLQKGYMISDRLLRPALVTVAQEKKEEDKTQG
jgi:molecular chaperone GrpE